MEAARTLIDLPERLRRSRFTAECEALRPQGVAYVRKHFGRSLDHADAEDVVAEVIIRFDRLDQAGRPPKSLRPAFFQSVRNAALDLLRYRGVRPTAPLEAAASEFSDSPGPAEQAEAREEKARLREALARMRPNYREAIVLRFGVDLSVPELAEQSGISLAAAKKRVLRSTAQIRERMEAIEERRFCKEIQQIPDGSGIDGFVAGISGEAEAAAIRAHLEHCGPCRGFLVALRSNLHELGGAALLGGVGAGKLGVLGPLASHLHTLTDGAHAAVSRLRLAGYRVGGALRAEGADSAGLLAGTGQKLAAVCAAGAAGAATCVASGIVGPGLGVAQHQAVGHTTPPPAHVRQAHASRHRPLITYRSPAIVEVEEASAGTPEPSPRAAPQPRHTPSSAVHQAKPTVESHTDSEPSTPTETAESQFGIESESSTATAQPAPAEASSPVAEARQVESTSAPEPAPQSSASKGATSGGHDEFGFGG